MRRVTPTPRRLATRSRSRPGARAIFWARAPADALGVKQELERRWRRTASRRNNRPRERHGDNMTGTARRETPQVAIFWLVQATEGEARLLAAGCPLDRAEPYGNCLTYGPGGLLRQSPRGARQHGGRPGLRRVRPTPRRRSLHPLFGHRPTQPALCGGPDGPRARTQPLPPADRAYTPNAITSATFQGLYGAAFAAVLDTPELNLLHVTPTEQSQDPARPQRRTPRAAAHDDGPPTQPRRAKNCSAARPG